MNILRHIVGIASELLTLKDPYDHYIPPHIVSETKDACGHVVQQTVRADNQSDATRHLQGTTIQGNRSIVATKIGKRTWNVHIEGWTTEIKKGGR